MRGRTCISFGAITCVAVLAASPLEADRARGPATQTLDVTVTVTGHAPEVAGSPAEYFVTFSAPVAVPRATLEAGTYIFRTVAPTIVRVSSPDRETVYATFLTTPVSRLTSRPRRAEVKFRKMGDGEAPRIVAFFPEYSSDGYEPVYPSGRSSASSSSKSTSSSSTSSKSSAVSG